MKILAHRGWWLDPAEKNTPAAFERALRPGFGLETDVRDSGGRLLVSHDMPRGDELPLENLLALVSRHDALGACPIALNIKADGLSAAAMAALKQHPRLDCFVFDMSVPDMRSWLATGVPVFCRLSDVETEPVWASRCAGVWLDAFESDWWRAADILAHLEAGRRVCVVSPELHGRPHLEAWRRLRPLAHWEKLMLCTDFPDQARAFMNPAMEAP